MGRIIAVCVSPGKGTPKQDVGSATLREDWGLEQDAHAGKWHRQVSLLSYEKFQAFQAKGAPIVPGAFGENLLVEGFDFRSLPVGTNLRCGEVLLEVTQIGKQCHHGCEIFHRMGECIMPTEGIFARVLRGGTVSVGDEMTLVEEPQKMPKRVAILVSSDSGSRGEREDLSGPEIARIMEAEGYAVVAKAVLPDERQLLAAWMAEVADQGQADLILTTGGTGFSPRDCMPEATNDIIERQVPGIPEAMRAYSMQITKRAMLTRASAGIRKGTLIVNLPGSPKAVRECLEYIADTLGHGLEILAAEASNCART